MKNLRDILSESFANDRIHKNPSIAQLHNIAKNSENESARFIVYDDKITFGADASKYIHHDLIPPEHKSPLDRRMYQVDVDDECPSYPHLRGMVRYQDGKYQETNILAIKRNGNERYWSNVKDHPLIDKFNQKTSIKEGYSLNYHKTLNQKLFDGDKLKPDVRVALLKIGQSFVDFCRIPSEAVKDIIFTGGNCNYNYSRFSDCDVHVVYDETMLGKGIYKQFLNDFFIDKKSLWGLTHDIKIKGYTVELYAQAYGDHLAASGVYSLLYNRWNNIPVHDSYKFKRDPLLNKKIDDLKKTIDNMIEMDSNEDEFRLMKEKLRTMRSAALESGNEFAFDNLVFKGLRNSGVMKRMNKHLRLRRDKELTLENKICLTPDSLRKDDAKKLTDWWNGNTKGKAEMIPDRDSPRQRKNKVRYIVNYEKE